MLVLALFVCCFTVKQLWNHLILSLSLLKDSWWGHSIHQGAVEPLFPQSRKTLSLITTAYGVKVAGFSLTHPDDWFTVSTHQVKSLSLPREREKKKHPLLHLFPVIFIVFAWTWLIDLLKPTRLLYYRPEVTEKN